MILISLRKVLNNASLPSEICLNGSNIKLSQTVRNLGVTVDQTLSFQQHISNVCRTCYLELRRISTIRHYLSEDTTKTLICAFALSRFDDCNALLSGSPKHLLDRLQKVQNNAARLIYRSSKFSHVTPLLHTLHWLPTEKGIDFKLASLCFKFLNGSAPTYLSDLLRLHIPFQQLCPLPDIRVFRIPSFRTKSSGQRSFSYHAPTTWNKPPTAIRHVSSVSSFRSSLKTFLFSKTCSSVPLP